MLELKRTYDAKGLAGESEASLPSAISAATASGPDPDEVLHAKHHDHDELLRSTQKHHHTPDILTDRNASRFLK